VGSGPKQCGGDCDRKNQDKRGDQRLAMAKPNGNDVSRGRWPQAALLVHQHELAVIHGLLRYRPTGLTYAPTAHVGRNGLTLEILFCGTNSMSPGRRCTSSRKSPLYRRFTSSFLTSTQSSETRRNSSTCECFALSLKPPAIATASVAVVSARRSYLPGLATSPATTKCGFSKSFNTTVTTGCCRMRSYAVFTSKVSSGIVLPRT